MYYQIGNSHSAEEFNHASKKGVWVILYYADWCPHCQTMKPEWDKFAQSGKVNCAEIESKQLDQLPEHKGNVQGFPTIVMSKNGKVVETYQGERSQKGFEEFSAKNSNFEQTNLNNLLKKVEKKAKKPKRKSKRRKSKKSKSKSKSKKSRSKPKSK